MPTSEADAASAATTVDTVPAEALTYHSIINSANEIVVGFLERIPYFVASIVVILIFWFLSIIFKKVVQKVLGSRIHHQN
ncbi:MAG: mechanosensitive ion channel family protein, partial [Psychrobacter sp.]|nr:mechanosensitive ion channel family protein [Psychrobacter sp.]